MRKLSLIAVALFAACADQSAVAPEMVAGSANRDAAASDRVIQSASGNAMRWSGGEPFILSFVANKHADGTVTGRYHADVKRLDARFDVRITCLTIEGNQAWVGGIIESSDSPLIGVGLASYFYVIDVGEGAVRAIQQDIVSALALNDTPGTEAAFCASRDLTLPSRRIEDGNAQVRP